MTRLLAIIRRLFRKPQEPDYEADVPPHDARWRMHILWGDERMTIGEREQ